MINIAVFVITITAPAGRLNTNDNASPAVNAMNDTAPDTITRERKHEAIFFAVSAGRIITPEINSVRFVGLGQAAAQEAAGPGKFS